MGPRLGVLRATWLVSIACIGSFLFAYDTGVVGGILTLDSFQKDFGYYGSPSNVVNTVNGNSGSILQGGAFFGCFFIWPIASRFGRRLSLALASAVFEIGTILQFSNTGSLWVFYLGRAVSGLAVGACTVLIPIFAGEMSPKDIRGRLGSFFQLFFAAGVAVSYWVDYAVSVSIPPSTRQWQIPIAIQFVPGALIGLGMLLVPESARWLVKKGRIDEARAALMWVRGDATGDISRVELAEIIAAVSEERRAAGGPIYRELLLPANRYRIFLAVTIQICQQLTGNTSLAYFAPQVFSAIAGGSQATDVYLTGLFGVVKVVGVVFFVAFFIDRIGRKMVFMAGAAAMGICMLAIALISAKHPPSKSTDDSNNPSRIGPYGVAAVVITYLEAFFFNLSWGPVAWLYIGEIFPSCIREIGVAAGAGAQWAANFAMSQATPHALGALGWKTFLMFACFNFGIVFYSYFFVKETSGHSLEEMDVVFGWQEVANNFEDARGKILAEEERNSRRALRYSAHVAAQAIVAARRSVGIPLHNTKIWTAAVIEEVHKIEAAIQHNEEAIRIAFQADGSDTESAPGSPTNGPSTHYWTTAANEGEVLMGPSYPYSNEYFQEPRLVEDESEDEYHDIERGSNQPTYASYPDYAAMSAEASSSRSGPDPGFRSTAWAVNLSNGGPITYSGTGVADAPDVTMDPARYYDWPVVPRHQTSDFGGQSSDLVMDSTEVRTVIRSVYGFGAQADDTGILQRRSIRSDWEGEEHEDETNTDWVSIPPSDASQAGSGDDILH